MLAKRETALSISRRLMQTYGDVIVDYSTVTKWLKQINDIQKESAKSDFCDKPRISRLYFVHSSANSDNHLAC